MNCVHPENDRCARLFATGTGAQERSFCKCKQAVPTGPGVPAHVCVGWESGVWGLGAPIYQNNYANAT